MWSNEVALVTGEDNRKNDCSDRDEHDGLNECQGTRRSGNSHGGLRFARDEVGHRFGDAEASNCR